MENNGRKWKGKQKRKINEIKMNVNRQKIVVEIGNR